jgi:hypothetical protein
MQGEALEQPATLAEGQVGGRAAVELEEVEDDVDERDAQPSVEHPLAEEREVRPAVLTECDELAIEYPVDRQRRELR